MSPPGISYPCIFISFPLLLMRSLSLSLLIVFVMMSFTSLFAATSDTVAPSAATFPTPSNVWGGPDLLTLSAASITPSAGSSLGEYRAVSCNSNSAFAINSCDQCFDGGSVKVGTRMTGLFDNWTNTSPNILKAIKDEQKTPNMVKFGNSIWTSTPSTESAVWKYTSDIVWTNVGSGTKQEFLLQPTSKVRWIEADLGAGYTLDKTDRKSGELVGMLRFPVVARTIDVRTASESAPVTRYECVAYKLDAPTIVITPVAPGTPPTKPIPPKEMTKTETGPETLLLIAAAFFIAFGMMFTLRRRI